MVVHLINDRRSRDVLLTTDTPQTTIRPPPSTTDTANTLGRQRGPASAHLRRTAGRCDVEAVNEDCLRVLGRVCVSVDEKEGVNDLHYCDLP